MRRSLILLMFGSRLQSRSAHHSRKRCGAWIARRSYDRGFVFGVRRGPCVREFQRVAAAFLRCDTRAGANDGFLAKGTQSNAATVSTAIIIQASLIAPTIAALSTNGCSIAEVSASSGPVGRAANNASGMPMYLAVSMSPVCNLSMIAAPGTDERQ